MSTNPHKPVLERLRDPAGRAMNREMARTLVELQAAPDVQARVDELAEKCNEGLLNPEERAEYETIVQAIHVIGILQRKARRVLANGPP